MTSIATSLQTDRARKLPSAASDSSYINTKSRESSKLSNGAAPKSNNFTPTLISDGKSINNTTRSYSYTIVENMTLTIELEIKTLALQIRCNCY